MYKRIHSQHHEIGSAITALGTAFGDAADIGLCFVAFHLVLGIFLSYQERWNLAAVVLLVIFEVNPSSHPSLLSAKRVCKGILCKFCLYSAHLRLCCARKHLKELLTTRGLAGGDEHPRTHRL